MKTHRGVLARGGFAALPPDAFSASAGLAVHVTDAGGLDTLVSWAASECKTSHRGVVHCRNAKDPSTRVVVRPVAHMAGHFTVSLRLSHLQITGPFAAPVTVTVTDEVFIDRVGTMSTCRVSHSGMRCVGH